jgi:hypothetical protein
MRTDNILRLEAMDALIATLGEIDRRFPRSYDATSGVMPIAS